MTTAKYYRYSLLLPLVVPALAWLVLREEPAIEGVTTVFALLFLSLVYGGAPYALLAMALLLWTRGKTVAEIERASFLAPLLLVPVFAGCLLAFVIATEGLGAVLAEPTNAALILLFFLIFVLAFGYAYVGLVHLGRVIGHRAGWLS